MIKETISTAVIHGKPCQVIERNRFTTLAVPGFRNDFHGRNLLESSLLLKAWVDQKPGKTAKKIDKEQEVRAYLRLFQLPRKTIEVSGRHVIPTAGRRGTTWAVRRALCGNPTVKVYFGSYKTHHQAAQQSIRLCQIINEEIELRNRLVASENLSGCSPKIAEGAVRKLRRV